MTVFYGGFRGFGVGGSGSFLPPQILPLNKRQISVIQNLPDCLLAGRRNEVK